MNQNLFKYIPSHITIDILSRLPVRTIARCKCVCMSWLFLLHSPEFVIHHLSKSIPGLALFHESRPHPFYTIFEFEDGQGFEHHDYHYNFVTEFKLPFNGYIQGSAHGFLFLRDFIRPNRLFICNPITREYIEIHCPQEFNYTYPQVVTFGFGASRRTGWRSSKVVRILRDEETHQLVRIPKSECHVYSLKTRSWRRTTTPPPLGFNCRTVGAFLNGNLHWSVLDLNQKPLIAVFDLETEIFTTIRPPPRVNQQTSVTGVFAFEDYLCVSDSSDEIVIWLMKENGVEKSWTKEFVISKPEGLSGEPFDVIRPIKVFEDDDVLMAWEEGYGVYYSSRKTRSEEQIDMFVGLGSMQSFLHSSSFLSLQSFGIDDVRFF